MLKIIDHTLYSGSKIRELQLRRPPVNAFDIELLQALKDNLQAAPEAAGAVVISAHGASFSAGMDVKQSVDMERQSIAELFQALADVTLAVGRSPIPVAFAITGNCLGAGAVFSLFADYRIMTRNRASFGITEVRGGMTLGSHVFAALSRILGEHRTQEFIMEAKVIDSRRAFDIGLVDRLEANHLVVSRALAWCDRVLKLPSKAMLETRALARADLHRALDQFQAQDPARRVNEWFDARIHSTIGKVLKT